MAQNKVGGLEVAAERYTTPVTEKAGASVVGDQTPDKFINTPPDAEFFIGIIF
ncbi:MAG: hypothetical protein AB8E87_05810 [Prochlorococcus sp.]